MRIMEDSLRKLFAELEPAQNSAGGPLTNIVIHAAAGTPASRTVNLGPDDPNRAVATDRVAPVSGRG